MRRLRWRPLRRMLAGPVAALGFSGVPAVQQLGEAEHGVERRAQLVAHVRKEGALGMARALGGGRGCLELTLAGGECGERLAAGVDDGAHLVVPGGWEARRAAGGGAPQGRAQAGDRPQQRMAQVPVDPERDRQQHQRRQDQQQQAPAQQLAGGTPLGLHLRAGRGEQALGLRKQVLAVPARAPQLGAELPAQPHPLALQRQQPVRLPQGQDLRLHGLWVERRGRGQLRQGTSAVGEQCRARLREPCRGFVELGLGLAHGRVQQAGDALRQGGVPAHQAGGVAAPAGGRGNGGSPQPLAEQAQALAQQQSALLDPEAPLDHVQQVPQTRGECGAQGPEALDFLGLQPGSRVQGGQNRSGAPLDGVHFRAQCIEGQGLAGGHQLGGKRDQALGLAQQCLHLQQGGHLLLGDLLKLVVHLTQPGGDQDQHVDADGQRQQQHSGDPGGEPDADAPRPGLPGRAARRHLLQRSAGAAEHVLGDDCKRPAVAVLFAMTPGVYQRQSAVAKLRSVARGHSQSSRGADTGDHGIRQMLVQGLPQSAFPRHDRCASLRCRRRKIQNASTEKLGNQAIEAPCQVVAPLSFRQQGQAAANLPAADRGDGQCGDTRGIDPGEHGGAWLRAHQLGDHIGIQQVDVATHGASASGKVGISKSNLRRSPRSIPPCGPK